MTSTPHSPPPLRPPSPLPLRLRLAPRAGGPRAIDGAWWPRSYDLPAELPGLLAGVPATWGRIASVVVSGAVWSPAPDRMVADGRMVRLRRSLTATAAHTVVLLAPGHGRWDLLVVPPDTTEEAAKPIMERATGTESVAVAAASRATSRARS
ncbi:DUF5994 family protein [Streptomyces longispororuber]|uniref:DUF5994 family protein n=1 Tax=Streptomyces longispororuber TaxID=68230 RepID=UPI0037009F3F